MATAKSAERSAKQASNSRPFKIAARVGILAYGVIHLLIAWLAVQIIFGGGGGTDASPTGAFGTIAAQPFGRVLLWLVVIGFGAVALWQLSAATWGFGYVSGRKRLLKRVAAAGRAVLFVGFAVVAGTVAAGGSSSGDGGRSATASVLGLPGGQVLVGAVGVGIAVGAGVMIYRGWQKAFTEDMDLGGLDRKARSLVVRLGQVGTIAKGVSILVVGILVTAAAVTFRPEKANGLDAALKELAAQPFGAILLVAVALGLACYGVFLFFDARYHRV